MMLIDEVDLVYERRRSLVSRKWLISVYPNDREKESDIDDVGKKRIDLESPGHDEVLDFGSWSIGVRMRKSGTGGQSWG